MEKDHKNVRAPTFDGESCNYQMWWVRFKAYAKISGFDKSLRPRIEPDMTESQEAAETLNEKKNN